MFEVLETAHFADWLAGLRDQRAKGAIAARINRMRLGNFGDVQPVGDGISEIRIHVGAGYRAYFKRAGLTIVVILCGGDKASQARDIRLAKDMAEEMDL